MLEGDLFNQEYIQNVKHWTEEILKNTNLEEKILMQKSKVYWIKLGDGNNAYFYANLKDKNKKTTLHRLEDNQRNNLTEIKDMEKEVLRFYGEFNGTSLTQLL